MNHPAARPWRVIVLAAFLALASAHADAVQKSAYAGEAMCLECHQVEDGHFGYTAHARAFRINPRTELEKHVCESCHGPGIEHMKKVTVRENIVSFTRAWGTPVDVQNAKCMACHQGGQRLHAPGSAHSKNGLSCADCHNPMARLSPSGALRKTGINATCESCHPQQRAEFRRRSHMPLPEGKMSCVDCHNPHGSPTAAMLKASSVNALCYSCHAEKRGPLLWEHAPVRENCLNCHSPHGSNHDKLLTVARPFLCQQCHDSGSGHTASLLRADQLASAASQGGTPSARVIGRACQNCHSQVHGSNHPAGSRLQR